MHLHFSEPAFARSFLRAFCPPNIVRLRIPFSVRSRPRPPTTLGAASAAPDRKPMNSLSQTSAKRRSCIFNNLRTLGSAKKINSPVLSAFRTLAAKTPGWHTPTPVARPAITPHSSTNPAKSENFQRSNPFLFNPRFHSSSLFGTFKKISPVFTHSSEKYPGVHSLCPLNSQFGTPPRSIYQGFPYIITSLLHYFVSAPLLPCLQPCETRSSLSRGVSQ